MMGELTDEQIDDLLHSEVIGRMGCHGDNKTYIVSMTYAFDGESIIGHTSEGMKTDILRRNPNVCFEVSKVHNMANWKSALVWGEFEELQGYEARLAMQKLINRIQSLKTDDITDLAHGIEAHQLDTGGMKTVVYRIKVLEKTGRFEKR